MSKYNQEINLLHKKTFPSRLRTTMEEKEKTQADLAREVGVSRQSIAKYMAGQAQPNIEALKEITKCLNVSADFLIGNNQAKSLDPNIQNISEYTGLSDKAITYFHNLKNQQNGEYYVKVFNALIDNNFIEEIITSISASLQYVKIMSLSEGDKNNSMAADRLKQLFDRMRWTFMQAMTNKFDEFMSDYSKDCDEELLPLSENIINDYIDNLELQLKNLSLYQDNLIKNRIREADESLGGLLTRSETARSDNDQ